MRGTKGEIDRPRHLDEFILEQTFVIARARSEAIPLRTKGRVQTRIRTFQGKRHRTAALRPLHIDSLDRCDVVPASHSTRSDWRVNHTIAATHLGARKWD